MKELSIEEKAKAYDEAIKRVENIKTGKCKTTFIFTAGLLEHLFPELKESEDERMMNQLHSWMKEFGGAEEYTEKVYQWIKGLLEKQGEQKDILEDAILDSNKDGLIADTIRYKKGQKSAEWSEEDREYMKSLLDIINGTPSLTPSEVECHKDWLIAIKDRVQPQPKQKTWSEEDEKMRALTIHYIREYQLSDRCRTTAEEDVETSDVCEEWLKSLRPQSQWRPNDEQIIALRWVLNNVPYSKHKEEISELLDQIKDL